MRILLPAALAALLPLFHAAARADAGPDEAVVKAIRAALGEKREEDRDKGLEEVLAGNPDWPSVRDGLIAGRYYMRVLVTEKGRDMHSGKHLGENLVGADQKERGFSFYLPTSYDSKKKTPVLVYLHHASFDPVLGRGKDRAGIAVTRFRRACEDRGILFVAPYTSKGAEWWTPEGRRLVAWTLKTLKGRYNLDENRIALAGALDGAEGVWYLGQNMPGTFSALLPMTGDPFEITGMIEPLGLGTLDRMPVLMGVTGQIRSNIQGTKNHADFLKSLKPLFDQRMRISTAVYPRARNDFSYLDNVIDVMTAFVLDKKRRPLADEVDVETTRPEGLRSLWLQNDGYDDHGDVAKNFKSTLLRWDVPKAEYKPEKKMGVGLRKQPWKIGLLVTRTSAGADAARLRGGDVLLEVDGNPVHTLKDVKQAVQAREHGDEVHVLVAREVRDSDLELEKRLQARYERVRKRAAELRARGEKVNLRRLWDDAAAEESASDSDDGGGDDGEVTIDIGGAGGGNGSGPKKKRPKGETEKTHIFLFERHVKVRLVHSGPLVHKGFGLRQDPSHDKEGVRIASVYAGSRAARAGFQPGDVIVGLGGRNIENARGLAKFLKGFDFQKEGFLEFTVRRKTEGGQWGPELTRRAEWPPLRATRVDVRWDQKENSCHVLARKCKGFTIYFADELAKPGEPFHLFINGVPYRDCVDPATMPEYPVPTKGSDPIVHDRLYRMRRDRARIDGWTPDPRFAVEQFLEHLDRELVVGAKRSFDLAKMKAGIDKYRAYFKSRTPDLGERVKKAYDRHKAEG